MARVSVSTRPPTLTRALGVRTVATNVVNTIVGSGIFALPGLIAAILGPAAAAAYLMCAAAMALVALCFAEVGSRVHVSGGAYAYVEAAFGRYLGFLAGVLFWFGSLVAASAAVSTIFVDSIGMLIPQLHGSVARGGILVSLYGGLALTNIRGVRAGARVMEVLTVAKIAPLAMLVIGGLFLIHPQHLAWSEMPSLVTVGRASLLLIFAFLGMEAALTSSGEIRDPSRTVPRAILLGLAVVTLLYAGLQVVSQGVLGPALVVNRDAPLAALAERVVGPIGLSLIAVAASVSAFGYVSGDLLASPRLLFAFARDGFLPNHVGTIHNRYETPYVAICAHAVSCTLVALSGTFASLAVLTTVSTLLIYLACCLAVLELRRRNVQADTRPFRIAGGPLVPLLACSVVLWLLSNASKREAIGVTIIFGLATAIYLLRRRAVCRISAVQ